MCVGTRTHPFTTVYLRSSLLSSVTLLMLRIGTWNLNERTDYRPRSASLYVLCISRCFAERLTKRTKYGYALL